MVYNPLNKNWWDLKNKNKQINEVGKEGKCLLTLECQPINIDGMIEIENHHLTAMMGASSIIAKAGE